MCWLHWRVSVPMWWWDGELVTYNMLISNSHLQLVLLSAWYFSQLGYCLICWVGIPRRCLRRLDFLLLTCWSRAAGWLGSLITGWSGWIDSSWSNDHAPRALRPYIGYPGTVICLFAHGPLLFSTPGQKTTDPFLRLCSRPTDTTWSPISWRHSCWTSCNMWHAGSPSCCWDVALLLLVQSPRHSPKCVLLFPFEHGTLCHRSPHSLSLTPTSSSPNSLSPTSLSPTSRFPNSLSPSALSPLLRAYSSRIW